MLATAVVFAAGADKAVDPYLKTVLDARVASRTPSDVRSDPDKVDHFIGSIDTLAKRGKKADKLLVELLDYYLGEGPVLEMHILQRGPRMIPILTEKKRHPLNCLPVYISICRDDVENRNDLIDSLINEIKNTKKHRAPIKGVRD